MHLLLGGAKLRVTFHGSGAGVFLGGKAVRSYRSQRIPNKGDSLAEFVGRVSARTRGATSDSYLKGFIDEKKDKLLIDNRREIGNLGY